MATRVPTARQTRKYFFFFIYKGWLEFLFFGKDMKHNVQSTFKLLEMNNSSSFRCTKCCYTPQTVITNNKRAFATKKFWRTLPRILCVIGSIADERLCLNIRGEVAPSFKVGKRSLSDFRPLAHFLWHTGLEKYFLISNFFWRVILLLISLNLGDI